MSESLSPVEVLLAKCQQVSEAIAGHREAISDLTAERDGMVAELRRLGLSERAVGRLLGISGPRVNQIMAAGPDVPVVVPDPFVEHGFGRNAAPEGVPPVVLQPPEPERVPAPRQKAACKHPGVGRKQRCRACGAFNV